MAYHITGAISAVIFLLTLSGLWSQLGFIFRRKRAFGSGELAQRPTAILSLNQFVSSFLAFFAFFLYGACLKPFNHYLVWPRLAATLLTLIILFEMLRDRRDTRSIVLFSACFALLVVTPAILFLNPTAAESGKVLSQLLIIVVTAILAQGYLHQVLLIRRTGQTGAVSLRMHQFFLIKDLSTIVFAFTMGIRAGWPILLLSSVSAATKAVTIWHFRWVRLSPEAEKRRREAAPAPLEVLLAPG